MSGTTQQQPTPGTGNGRTAGRRAIKATGGKRGRRAAAAKPALPINELPVVRVAKAPDLVAMNTIDAQMAACAPAERIRVKAWFDAKYADLPKAA
jgi:hypothetical protein